MGGRRTKNAFSSPCTKEESLCLRSFLKSLRFYSSGSIDFSSALMLRHLCNSGRTEHVLAIATDFDKSPGLYGMQKDIVRRNAILSVIIL